MKKILIFPLIFSLILFALFFGNSKPVHAEDLTITHMGAIWSVGDPNYLGGAWGIFARDDYVYVGARQVDALTIFDVSNPANPIHTDAIRGIEPPICMSGASGLVAVGDYAYITAPDGGYPDRYNALTSLDISDPYNITHVDSIIGGGYPTYLYGAVDVKVQSNYAYVVSYHANALTIFDISNPADLKHVGALVGKDAPNYLYGPYGLDVEGDYAYVACIAQHSLTIVDISNPASPVTVGVIKGGWPDWYPLSGAWDVFVEGDYAYVACMAENALTVIDISDPTNPTLESTISGAGSPNYLGGACGVFVTGNYACVTALADDALTIIDISDPANPVHSGTISGDGDPNYLNAPMDLFVIGDYIYVVSSEDHAMTVFQADLSEKSDIDVSPPFKFFDNVDVGSQASRVFVITNDSGADGDLNIGDITISGDDADQFSITSDDASNQVISPGNSAAFTVTYTPDSTGSKTATVLIPSNDPDENPFEVFLCAGNEVGDFVTRFYQLCLNREPDQQGLEYWATELLSGRKTGEDIAYGFIFSGEFLAKNHPDDTYVDILYDVILDREPDQGGFDYWVGLLESGVTRSGILYGFIHSPLGEFEGICNEYGITPFAGGVTGFVDRFYSLTLNRLPDMEGQAYWVNRLNSDLETGESIGENFIFSAEFTGTNPSDQTFVSILYIALLGRNPEDSAVMDYWTDLLDAGTSREDLFDDFVHMPEFQTVCASYGIEPY